jgi:hypothetical protein
MLAKPEATATPAAIPALTGEVGSPGINCDVYAFCAERYVSIVAVAICAAFCT